MTKTSNRPALRAEAIEKTYPGAPSPAVKDFTLDVEEGEFICLLGPSGCGKSTMLRTIAGLERPNSGKLSSHGRVLSDSSSGIFVPPERRGFGLVFQSYALWPHMTVTENIEFGLRVRRDSQATRRKRVAELLELLQIDGLGKRYPAELSGGQQQRVALARMLAIEPAVLLLDEPLSNLDAALRIEMQAELKRLHREVGNTIVLVTHDQNEAMSTATKLVLMKDGAIQQIDSPMDVYRYPSNVFVAEFVGNPPMAIIPLQGETEEVSELTFGIRSSIEKFSHYPNVNSKEAASVGIRPEAIGLSPEPSSLDSESVRFPGIVESVLPLGPSWLVRIEASNQLLYAEVPHDPKVVSGDAVECFVAFQNLRFFDAHEELLT